MYLDKSTRNHIALFTTQDKMCELFTRYNVYSLANVYIYGFLLFKSKNANTRWIWLKVGQFDSSSLKSVARRFSERSVRPPSCESPLKIPRHLVQLLPSRILIRNAVTEFIMLQGWEKHGVFGLVSTSLQASSCSCHYRRAFIAPLPISRSIHSAVVYKE